MSRIIRMGIVLGIAVATLGVSAALAADWPSDAFDRTVANGTTISTDASDRAQAVTTVPTDSHERAQPSDVTTGPVAVEDSGWNVSWTNVVLGAAIGAGIVVAGVLLVSAIRRRPPRGHPPLVHR